MKPRWAFLLAVFVAAVSSPAAASMVYSVNLVTTSTAGSGTETFTGTITTDGTLGALTASNFVDWAITGAGPVSIGVSQAGPGGSVSCGPSGCGINATSTELDLTGGGGFTFDNFSGLINITTLQLGFGGAGFGYPYLVTAIIAPSMSPPSGGFFGYSTATIATVSSTSTVPEPSTTALIAIALILFASGAAATRRGEYSVTPA
jgi:hypothetical protein